MAIKNKKKSRKTSRKNNRKPRRKASRKTSRKPRRKASRKTSRKPHRKASRKTSKKKSKRNKFRVKTIPPRRDFPREPGRGVYRPNKIRLSPLKLAILSRREKVKQYIRLFGCCAPPPVNCESHIQKILSKVTSKTKPDHYSCANYIINGHGLCTICQGPVCAKNYRSQNGIDIPGGMEIILYSKIGKPLWKHCSVAWRQYLKRVPKDSSFEEKQGLLRRLIKSTTETVSGNVSSPAVANEIKHLPCGNLKNPVGYYKSPDSLENWTTPVWAVPGRPEYGKGRVLGPHFTGGQYGFSVDLGPEYSDQQDAGQKKRSEGGKYYLDTFASVLDINSCCHYRLNGSRDTFGYEPRTRFTWHRRKGTDPGFNGKPINTPTVLMQIKEDININEVLKRIQRYNKNADLYDPKTKEYIKYPEKIKVHLFSCLSFPPS